MGLNKPDILWFVRSHVLLGVVSFIGNQRKRWMYEMLRFQQQLVFGRLLMLSNKE